MNKVHVDWMKLIGGIVGFVGYAAPMTHWDPGTTALVLAVAHAAGSWVQTKLPAA